MYYIFWRNIETVKNCFQAFKTCYIKLNTL